MDFEKAVSEVKDRLETVGTRGQGVAKVSLKTLKSANDVVLNGVQGLVKTQTEAAKDLYSIGKESFDKAVAAGLVAVVSNPIEYIPDGRDTIVGAFSDTVDTVTKTGGKLAKVVKTGYQDVTKTIQGKPLRKATRKGARKARKATHSTTATPAAA